MNKIMLFPIAALTAIALFLASCREDGPYELHDSRTPALFVPGFHREQTGTRAVDTEWSEGDKAGICMVEKNNAGSYLLEPNSAFSRYRIEKQTEKDVLVADNGYGEADQTIYYPARGEVKFIAFSPYREVEGSPPGHTVAYNGFSDQAERAGMEAVDFLYCKLTEESYSNARREVELTFEHRFSKLVIQVETGNVDKGSLSELEVTVGNLPGSATVSLEDGGITPGGRVAAVTPFVGDRSAYPYRATAIVVPHEEGSERDISFRLGNIDAKYTLPEGFGFESGYAYLLRFNLTGYTVELSETRIIEWSDGNPEWEKGYAINVDPQVEIHGKGATHTMLFMSDCPAEEAGNIVITYDLASAAWLSESVPLALEESRDDHNLYSFTYQAKENPSLTAPRSGVIRITSGKVQQEVTVVQSGGHEQAANCYVVPHGQTIYIPVSRANEFTRAIGSLYDAIGAETPFTASLLWSTNGGDLVALEVVGSGSRGLIKVTGSASRAGNAVIAVKVNGEIKWSWHIWVTGYDPDNSNSFKKFGDYVLMDRNLGATDAIEGSAGAYGLLYQWGRKDPFPGSTSTVLYDQSEPSIYDGATGAITNTFVLNNVHPGQRDIASTVKEPTRFIAFDGSWLKNSLTSDDLWSASQTDPKSLYDPCPAGWRVPPMDIWKALDEGNFYWSAKKGYCQDDAGWFPASGFRHSSEAKLVSLSDAGYIWSANSTASNATDAHFMSYYRDKDPKFYPFDTYYRACGFSVRCIRGNCQLTIDNE